MKTNPCRKAEPGVALIMIAGVLAVLAALATGFYTMMVMQTRSATRYADSVRAEMMAKAGVADAVARLREQAFKKTEDPTDPWYNVDYFHGARKRVSYAADLTTNSIDDDGDGVIDNPEEKQMAYSGALGSSAGTNSDRYILEISDASSRVNVNAGENMGVILDNLCRVIGAPLIAADLNALQPRCWVTYGADAALFDPGPNPPGSYSLPANAQDKPNNRDVYYKLDSATNLPLTRKDGTAIFGDGYAIAGYRARYGRFRNIDDVKNALTYVKRNTGSVDMDRQLEQLEREVKFSALKNYITIDSWVDTNTVCVGKFEWIYVDTGAGGKTIAIDRDKSWVSSVDDSGAPITDPLNERGTLRGSYVSIMNGHGAGQLRRIKENGIDWIEVDGGFEVPPGPISSYMIMAKEDALTETVSTPNGSIQVPKVDPSTGILVDDPNINYQLRPLCIHRAPVNINTASDKVLAALFMGLNVQHGHPMAVGTDADKTKIVQNPLPAPPGNATDWKTTDPKGQEPYLLTVNGLKRIPASSGRIVYDKSIDDLKTVLPVPDFDINYLNNYGLLDPAGNVKAVNEAQELAMRIISARQRKLDPATGQPVASDPDPFTADPANGFKGYERGPFKSWDDFFFRVVKPWDADRLDPAKNPNASKKISVARMIMANFNSNTDIFKFNPNIEWIDRWGRNFTEMEPVMVFDGTQPYWLDYAWPPTAASDGMWDWGALAANNTAPRGSYYIRSMRYKSDELIDKTDLNRSTTEFSFDSGGTYEIISIGQVARRGEVLAERKIEALVKVYDVWRESTQAQFVQGKILPGPSAPPMERGTNYSGQVTRDSNPNNDGSNTLPLVTLPEPLVPLKYRINNPNGLTDQVAKDTFDAFGNSKQASVPDVLANRVLPAQYDGQISLATNTSAKNDGTTFLASFNGDLDTDTSDGNGREQAKIPSDKKTRVLDTFSLLGLLNDKQVDFDPMDPVKNAKYATFPVQAANKAFKSLDPANYWENVTCRMGDLRSEGVWLGAVGVSGRDGTLKYLIDGHKNYKPMQSPEGNVVCMWFKPTWQSTDHREHEFFNACNKGGGFGARYDILCKYGRFSWAIPFNGGGDNSVAGAGGTHVSDNDLCACIEDSGDADLKAYLHGGTRRVPASVRESPSYHVQPFRWSFVGERKQWNYSDTASGYQGFWENSTSGLNSASNKALITNHLRPFIDTQRDPQGPGWDANGARYYWSQNDAATFGSPDIGDKNYQEAAWSWADGGTSGKPVFSVNNLNEKFGSWLYRASPIDGTYAVIDEMKITSKLWDADRIGKEQTISRYYLPPNPSDPQQCPVFVSQSLLQSLRGMPTAAQPEYVALARVSWNVFTPRFMYEYKEQKGTRNEIISAKPTQAKFKGPFDFVQYNYWILPSIKGGSDTRQYEPDINPEIKVLGVKRPSPNDYISAGNKQSHATRGVEVELLDEKYPDASTARLAGKTFVDPDAFNQISTDVKNPIRVATDRLHYRVRFRYPVDPLVGGVYNEAAKEVDPATMYLLDTPVFDDISITYFAQPRFLSYREIRE